jgi:hypothetical protein
MARMTPVQIFRLEKDASERWRELYRGLGPNIIFAFWLSLRSILGYYGSTRATLGTPGLSLYSAEASSHVTLNVCLILLRILANLKP